MDHPDGNRPHPSDTLDGVARKAVEIRSCDRCGVESAHTWVIVGPDGLAREIELCDPHSGPVANTYALARPVAAQLIAGRPKKRAAEKPPAPQVVAAPEPEPIWR